MADRSIKSTVTCDMEGRIETFNSGAEQVFGYRAAEVIGKKRVSVFSPGAVVLAHVPGWLKTASVQGEFRGRSVFVRQDGSLFAADIRITPTFRGKTQVGYCGVTMPRPDVPLSDAMPPISVKTRLFAWLVIMRLPFLTATLMPVLIGAAWVAANQLVSPFPWLLFGLTLVGAALLHIAANTWNDYFDWRSGADRLNNDYFLPYSGGSRSIELGLISERGMLSVGIVALALAAACGVTIMALTGELWLMAFGAVGAFSAYFYTAPPLRLAARKGLGELLIGLNFGPLMTAGVVMALTGAVTWTDFLVGAPVGLLTAAILWINQFPDETADRASGKLNLVVVLGKERARWGYLALLGAAFGFVVVGVAAGIFPKGALAILFALPLAYIAARELWRHYRDRALVKANAATINLQLAAGLLMAVGIFASGWLMR